MADYEDVIVVDFDNTICPFREDFTCVGARAGGCGGACAPQGGRVHGHD